MKAITLKSFYPLLLLAMLVTAAPSAWSKDPSAPAISADVAAAKAQADLEAAYAAINKAAQRGPRTITLADQATLKLPQDYVFIPAAETIQLLKANGNDIANSLGMIASSYDDWGLLITYEPTGYIEDTEAKTWQAAELLADIRAGAAATNEERKSRHIPLPEQEIIGWHTEPTYNAETHQLVWGVELRLKGQSASKSNAITYTTVLLGREGYFTLNLAADTNTINTLKPTLTTLVSNLKFNEGKRYADFNASTDKTAEYGLAALVAGGAVAKKLGLFAAITVAVIKFWKFIAILLAGFGMSLSKWFSKRKNS